MKKENKETLGQLIARLIKERKMKVKDVAGVCGCDVRHLRRILRDECFPNLNIVEWFSVIFGIPVEAMLAKRLEAKHKEFPAIKKRMGW